MNIKNIVAILLFALGFSVQAQNIGLIVGDTLPTVRLPKILNNSQRISNSSEFRNQLLIIDFWATGCGSCIAALPKMEMLQKKFGSKLRILPVTYEKEDLIRKFWHANKYTRDLTISSVVEDESLHSLFKHKYIPHEIWVYKNKIIGITSGEYVDEYSIRKVLNGDSILWPIKNDFYSFDRSQPLFSINDRNILDRDRTLRYVAISDFRKKNNSPVWLSGGAGIIRDTLHKTIRSFFLNQPIVNSYLFYWTMLIPPNKLIKPLFTFQANQILWKVVDKSRYYFQKKPGEYSQNWLEKNGICFESLKQDTGQTDLQIYSSNIKDLNRLLGLNVRWVKVKEKVLVLTKSSEFVPASYPKTSSNAHYTVYDVFYNLNDQPDNPYVFDESGESSRSVQLNITSWTDLDKVSKELSSVGLILYHEEREVDKLCVEEVGNSRIVDVESQHLYELNRKNQGTMKDSIVQEATFFNSNRILPGIKELPSGLQYKILKVGGGSRPQLNSNVLVQYEGRLVSGKLFDSSYEHGFPLEIKVDGAIKGWSEALQLMNEGSEWELYLPPSLAYGNHTGNGRFPPNSILIFKLKLNKILK